MTEFTKRTLSGAVYVGCIVGSILWSKWAFAGLLLPICLLAVDEFHRLVKSPVTLRVCAALATLVLWLMCSILAGKPGDGEGLRGIGISLILAYLPIIVVGLLDEIWNHSERPLQNWGDMLISQIMIAIPLLNLLFLMSLDNRLLLALFVLIWVNDSGAYIVGSLTAKRPQGNHKMTPHISPKKSWEGLAGGVGFALIAVVILYLCGWFEVMGSGLKSFIFALIFAAFVALFGTMGDLMESLMKRSLGIKDSGVFLPGHGGVLDRFDSILLASPIVTAFCWLCYFILPLL
jgi:phosphatidate cytidylyltransferase